jgi:hypothetical protein
MLIVPEPPASWRQAVSSCYRLGSDCNQREDVCCAADALTVKIASAIVILRRQRAEYRAL